MNLTQNPHLKALTCFLSAAAASAMLWTGWFIVFSIYLAPLTLLDGAPRLPTHWLALFTAAAVFYKIYREQARFTLKEAVHSSLALCLIVILAQFAASLLALGAVCAASFLSAAIHSTTLTLVVCALAWCLSTFYFWLLTAPWLRHLVAPLTEEAKIRLNF